VPEPVTGPEAPIFAERPTELIVRDGLVLGALPLALAGLAGDKWSLGFVVETERQVESHLEGHLSEISPSDGRTRAILERMKEDEIHHADLAKAAGGASLPGPVKLAMRLTSEVMTKSVYWI